MKESPIPGSKSPAQAVAVGTGSAAGRAVATAEQQTVKTREPRAVPRPASRPMRVVHISNIEGSNYFLNNLCDFTDPSEVKYSSVTFAERAGFVEALESRGVNVYALNAMSHSRYPQAVRRIWEIVEREQADVVHTHLFEPTVLGLLIGRLRGRKVIVTRHHSDAIYSIKSPTKRRVCLALERFINDHAHHLIAPSTTVRDILLQRENVPAYKVSLIPYGQTADRFDTITPEAVRQARAELGMDGHLALVCISRLYHRKGHIYLFDALAPLLQAGLNVRLYLVGTGADEYRAELKAHTKRLGIHERVQFLGWRNDALKIMAAADIVVHPSLEDALSSALIESVMLARPIVATDISGARDTLADGRFGVLVPPADADAFRGALQKVIANLDEFREQAKGGREHILNYMGAERVAREYAACYRKVLGWE